MHSFQPSTMHEAKLIKSLCHDDTLAIQALKPDEALYPAYKPFPTKEAEFNQFFHVHLIPKPPVHQNLVMVGCHFHITKMISKLKKSNFEDTSMMDWLKAHHIYIEVNTLG